MPRIASLQHEHVHNPGLNPITALRMARGYSVDDLAETSGLTAREITDVETGLSRDAEHLRRIAKALKL